MDLHHLEHFVVLAEEESLTAAAHRLHLAQSSVSTSLASLERAVGARLVDRGPGRSGLELTRAGRIFLTHAYTVLQAVRTAREAVHTEPGDLHGTIRIATTMIPRDADVAAAVRRFLQDHPRVRLDVAHGPAPQVMSLLERGEADLACPRGPTPCQPRSRTPRCCALPWWSSAHHSTRPAAAPTSPRSTCVMSPSSTWPSRGGCVSSSTQRSTALS